MCITYSDRKSTRLNSSHLRISYAVFCLKKKRRSPWCRPRHSRRRSRFSLCAPTPLPADQERISFRSSAEDREDHLARAKENVPPPPARRFRDRLADRQAQATRKREFSARNHAARPQASWL